MNWLRKWPARAMMVRGWRPEGSSRKASGMVLAPRRRPCGQQKTLSRNGQGSSWELRPFSGWFYVAASRSAQITTNDERRTLRRRHCQAPPSGGAAGSPADIDPPPPEMLAPRPLAQPCHGDEQRRRLADNARQQQRKLGAPLVRIIEQRLGLGDQHIDREWLRQIGAADTLEPLTRRRLARDDQHGQTAIEDLAGQLQTRRLGQDSVDDGGVGRITLQQRQGIVDIGRT